MSNGHKVLPKIIGGAGVAIGVLSVLSAGNGNAVINTPGGNGWDMLVSVAVVGLSVAIWKSGSTLAALGWAAAMVAMTTYASWSVNTQQAYRMTESMVVAGKAAATAAANSAGQQHRPAQVQAGIPAGHRALTGAERQWCNANNKNSESAACQVGYCAVSACGAQGK